MPRYIRDPTTGLYRRSAKTGRYWFTNGNGPKKCCGCGSASSSSGNDCTLCAINTWTLTFAGVQTDAIGSCRPTQGDPNNCPAPGFSTKILTNPINGTFTLTYANPEFRGANGGQNTPAECIWYARLPGSFAVYTDPCCNRMLYKVCNDGWIVLHASQGFWNVNAWLGAEGDEQTSFGPFPWLDMSCFCAFAEFNNPNSGFFQIGVIPLFTAGGGPVALPGIGGPGNCGGWDCISTFTLRNRFTDHNLNTDPTISCGDGRCGTQFPPLGAPAFAFTSGWGGTVTCTPH